MGNRNAANAGWQSVVEQLQSTVTAGHSEASFFLWEGAKDHIIVEMRGDSLVVRSKQYTQSNASMEDVDDQTLVSARLAITSAAEELMYDDADIQIERFANFIAFQADVLFQRSPLSTPCHSGVMISPDPTFRSFSWPSFFASQSGMFLFVQGTVIPALLELDLPIGRCLLLMLLFRWMSEEAAWFGVLKPAIASALASQDGKFWCPFLDAMKRELSEYPFPGRMFSTRDARRPSHLHLDDVQNQALLAQNRGCRCVGLGADPCPRDGRTNTHICQMPHAWSTILLACARGWGEKEASIEACFWEGLAGLNDYVTSQIEGIGQFWGKFVV